MAQPPFRSDAFEVENADAPVGPRLLEADENDGSLRFTDTRIPGGISLFELAGIQQANNTIVVSPTGAAASKDANGDSITTVQAGLDAVPVSADVNDPWTVLLAPGIYVEDLLFIRDGVTLRGLGNVTLRSAGSFSTVRISAGPASVPRRVRFQDLRIENTVAGEACVDVSSTTFATGTFTIASVPSVGDTATVDVTVLTAIANGGVPAPGEFELGTDAASTATNLADAIADPVNGLNTLVVVTVVGPVVTVRALNPGVGGNTIALASSVPLVIVPSGATLTGGTDASPGSTVGNNLIEIIDCDLVATGAAGFQLRATSINNISVRGGDWSGSATTTSVSVTECASVSLVEQQALFGVTMNYSTAAPNIPSIATCAYSIQRARSGYAFASNLAGAGSVTMQDVTFLGAVGYTGDGPLRTFDATGCRFGPLTLGGAGTVTLSRCTRGVLVAAGTGTLAETESQGNAVFAATANVTVPFTEPQPDAAYMVLLEVDGPPAAITDVPSVPAAAKLAASFDITFGGAQTTTVNYVVRRDI